MSKLQDGNAGCVAAVGAEGCYANAKGPAAPRPYCSASDLGKIESCSCLLGS